MEEQPDKNLESRNGHKRVVPGVLIFLIACLVAITVVILSIVWSGRQVVQDSVAGGERIASMVRDAIVDIARVEPEVQVDETVIVEQSSQIAQLSLVSRPIYVEREMEHTYLGSTKRVRLQGRYEAKAGYDLNKPFSVKVSDDKVVIEIPEAELLSLEPVSVEVDELRGGLWNRIKPEEVEAEMDALRDTARRRALETGLADEAAASFIMQMESRLEGLADVEIVQNPLKESIPD